jgi:hypothetical protein
MNIHSALEIAKKLRKLAHMGDYGYDKSDMILELIAMADDYQDLAEAMEMEMIVQMQRDWVEAN